MHEQLKKLEVFWIQCLQRMVKGGWVRKEMPEDVNEVGYSFNYTNEEVQRASKRMPLSSMQYLNYISRECRNENTALTKKVLLSKLRKSSLADDIRSAGSVSTSSEKTDTVKK